MLSWVAAACLRACCCNSAASRYRSCIWSSTLRETCMCASRTCWLSSRRSASACSSGELRLRDLEPECRDSGRQLVIGQAFLRKQPELRGLRDAGRGLSLLMWCLERRDLLIQLVAFRAQCILLVCRPWPARREGSRTSIAHSLRSPWAVSMASFISPSAAFVISVADPWNEGGKKTLRRLCKLNPQAFQLGSGGSGLSFRTEPGVSQLVKFLDTLIVLIEEHLSFQEHRPERLVAGFRSGRSRWRLRGRGRPRIGCLRCVELLEPFDRLETESIQVGRKLENRRIVFLLRGSGCS